MAIDQRGEGRVYDLAEALQLMNRRERLGDFTSFVLSEDEPPF